MMEDPKTVWEKLIEDEAAETAEAENERSGVCGPYGTEAADDYREDVRKQFEEIGRAYIAMIIANFTK